MEALIKIIAAKSSTYTKTRNRLRTDYGHGREEYSTSGRTLSDNVGKRVQTGDARSSSLLVFLGHRRDRRGATRAL